MGTEKRRQEQKKLTTLYAGFTLVIIAQFIPVQSVQIITLIMAIMLLFFLYSCRKKSEPDSLTHNHVEYLIRTFWISSLFISLGIILFCGILLQYGDHTPFLDFIDQIENGLYPSEQAIEKAYHEMIGYYFEQNKILIISTATPTLGLSILYLFYRLIKGFLFLKKTAPIEQVKSWF